MEQYDGERVVAQVAIAIWLRRMMQYREPLERAMRQRVKLIVRSSCGVTEHRQRRVTLQIKNRIRTKLREKRVVAFLSVKNQASNAPKVCESKKQVSRSRSRKHQCMNTKNDTSVESDQNVTTQA